MLSQAFIATVADGLALIHRVVRPLARPILRLLRLSHLRQLAGDLIPVTTQFDGPVHAPGRLRLQVGEHCRLGRDVYFETQGQGQIAISDHVRINMGCVLVSYNRIAIGHDCLIGEYVSIRDADHGLSPGQPMRAQVHSAAPIHIGNDVWIGRGAVILKGVTVGSGAVIGANSVVTHDVPPLALVAGCPARELRRRGTPNAAAPPSTPLDHARSS